MAIVKQITLPNGIPVNYHRVVSLNVITNVQNVIEVASYTSKDKRQEEMDIVPGNLETNVYIHTQYISAPYDQDMSIRTSYDYIKTLEQFQGAEDDI